MAGNPFYPADDYYSQYGYGGNTGFGTIGPPRGPSLFGFNATSPSGPLEGIAQSVLPMVAEMLRREFGGAAFQFGADMNVLSGRYSQQYLQNLNNARMAGATADTEQVRQLVAGVARMLGNDLRDEGVRRSIGVLSQDISGMLPILASMFPDSIDRLFPRGSMTVAAQSFTAGGRFVFDPSSGLPVMLDPNFGTRIVGDLFTKGPEATAGLGAGRVGQLFETLVGQGLIGSGGDLRRQVLAGELTGEGAQGIQAARIKSQLERYSGTIAAINDIFAENGQANRPMAELVRGLQTLTQGSFGVVDPTTLAARVRSAQAFSQITGVSMDQIAASGGLAAGALLAGGMNRRAATFLADPTGLYSLTVARTYADQGLIFEGPEGQTELDARNRAGRKATAGYTSDFGRLLGAIFALSAVAGDDTPLGQLAQGLRGGRLDAAGIDLRTASFSQINDLVTSSGLGQNALLEQLGNQRQNDLALADPRNLGAREAIRARQLETVRQMFLAQLSGADWQGTKTLGDPDAVFRALQVSARNPLNRSDLDRVNEVGERFGMGRAERALLLSRFFGKILPEGGFDLADLSVDTGGLAGDVETRQRALGFATSLMRGGFLRNIGVATAEYGLGGRDVLGTVMRAFGLVSDEEVLGAIGRTHSGGPTDRVRKILGVYGYGPAGESLERALRAGEVMSGKRSPEDYGGGGDFGPEAGGRVSNVQLKIEIARAEFVQDGRGMTISGGGAMRSGTPT